MKLIHTGEDRMRVTVRHLHYGIKGKLEVSEYCSMGKIRHKFLQKVAEERNLKPVKMIDLDLSS